MASKKSKAVPADDDLEELLGLGGLGNDSKPKKSTHKSKPTSAASKAIGDQDILADLESELASEQPSRPHTPRIKETRRSTATPPTSDDRAPPAVVRQSTDSARSLRATFTPSATSSELHEAEKQGTVEQQVQQQQQQQPPKVEQSGGGWWGGLLSTASAAMKTAEAAVSQIQQNEEAKKWADQVKGIRSLDVGAIRNYGMSSFGWSTCFVANVLFKVTNSAIVLYLHSPTSSTPSRPRSAPTNVFSFTSRTISLDTPPSTPSSILFSTVSCPKLKEVIFW